MTDMGMFCVSLVIFFTIVGLAIAGTIAIIQETLNHD